MNPVDAAVDALRAGRPVLVVDDADRENEGDVVLAADRVDRDWIAWTIRNTSGLLCAPLTAERADSLDLPPMVRANQDPKQTAYTVTVDAAEGVTTGISADDRARTLRVLAAHGSTPASLIRPGHILPLRARPGGVLERPGHTEAAVDLCRLAGLSQVAAIAELVADDGTMLRMAGVGDLAERYRLPVLTVEELVNYRTHHRDLAPASNLRVKRTAETRIPTRHGVFRALGYRDTLTGAEHLVVLAGTVGDDPLVRVHSECLTGEAFGSLRCECGPQLDTALERISGEGGVVVYLRGHEGRGIGLLKKLAAYRLQDSGYDTVEANEQLGEPVDGREYGAAAAILDDLSVSSVKLLTNNPNKIAGLQRHGITVTTRVPLHVGRNRSNIRYLEAKQRRMGHLGPSSKPVTTSHLWPLLVGATGLH